MKRSRAGSAERGLHVGRGLDGACWRGWCKAGSDGIRGAEWALWTWEQWRAQATRGRLGLPARLQTACKPTPESTQRPPWVAEGHQLARPSTRPPTTASTDTQLGEKRCGSKQRPPWLKATSWPPSSARHSSGATPCCAPRCTISCAGCRERGSRVALGRRAARTWRCTASAAPVARRAGQTGAPAPVDGERAEPTTSPPLSRRSRQSACPAPPRHQAGRAAPPGARRRAPGRPPTAPGPGQGQGQRARWAGGWAWSGRVRRHGSRPCFAVGWQRVSGKVGEARKDAARSAEPGRLPTAQGVVKRGRSGRVRPAWSCQPSAAEPTASRPPLA